MGLSKSYNEAAHNGSIPVANVFDSREPIFAKAAGF